MGVGAGLYMYDVVVKSSRSLSHLLMSFLLRYASGETDIQTRLSQYFAPPIGGKVHVNMIANRLVSCTNRKRYDSTELPYYTI